MTAESCPLCRRDGEHLLWQGALCRVIMASQLGYPGFCRVIWQEHVREMTDLPAERRSHMMMVVWAVEEALRQVLNPDKINLASLGNQVPHLHWHIIPRYKDDAHFPDAIWAPPRRAGLEHPVDMKILAEAIQRLLGPGI